MIVRFYHKIWCFFKGHVGDYIDDEAHWELRYKSHTSEIMRGYICKRCWKFQFKDWFLMGDSDFHE